MKKLLPAALSFCLLFSSCATYHLSTPSLMQQFADAHKEKKITVLVAFPFFFPGVVTGNDVKELHVLDKKDNERMLYVTRHTGVKITKTNGKHVTFYFDTLLLKDSTISGSVTHFFNAPIRPVKLADIARIELQK